jgi:hypothetical protein
MKQAVIPENAFSSQYDGASFTRSLVVKQYHIRSQSNNIRNIALLIYHFRTKEQDK